MSKFRPEPLSLFYFLNREEAESTFNALATICDTIKAAKHTEQARAKLKTLLRQPQLKVTKELIRRLLPLDKDRMERIAETGLRRVFTSTMHYDGALMNRTRKARIINLQEANKTQ
jgi:hypothetical protein